MPSQKPLTAVLTAAVRLGEVSLKSEVRYNSGVNVALFNDHLREGRTHYYN